jgi:hypothetical protein
MLTASYRSPCFCGLSTPDVLSGRLFRIESNKRLTQQIRLLILKFRDENYIPIAL